MPLYEYRCEACNAVTQVFTRTISQQVEPVCQRCKGTQLRRLVSRVAHHRSARDVWERSGTPDSPGPDYYRDASNIGRGVERDFERLGVDMPKEVRDRIDAARGGELPKELDL